jgi:adenosylmethionine-8-amino-7-oxononanoate aminotransferase
VDGLAAIDPEGIAGLVIEPLIQGAAGMKIWPPGMLKSLREWCDSNDVLLIFDEVMTGFGRTGRLFACLHEDVFPDFLALAKGLTGGYLPLAATLTTERVFSGFLGTHEELRTFFYGHSYSGNSLGCAAALGNLRVFEEERTLELLQPKIEYLCRRLQQTRQLPGVREIRRCGFIAGIELQRRDGNLFQWQDQAGVKVCLLARRHGLLTRPIGNVVILMLPLCVSLEEIDMAVEAIERAMADLSE